MTEAPLVTPRGVMDWTKNRALSAVLEPCACCHGIKTIQLYEAWGMLCDKCATAVGEDPRSCQTTPGLVSGVAGLT